MAAVPGTLPTLHHSNSPALRFWLSWGCQHMPQVQIHNGRIKQQAVQQVEHAANAGEEPARILRPGFAFEEGFDQIPNYGTNAQDDPQDYRVLPFHADRKSTRLNSSHLGISYA